MYRLLLTILLLTGCVYPYRGVLGSIDTIAIPFADNLTAEAAVADSLTFATAEAFNQDGQWRVVNAEGADAILYLDILFVEDRAHPWSRPPSQYRLSVVVSVEIKAFDGSPLLKQYESIGWGTYEWGTNEWGTNEDDDERKEAIGKAVRMVAWDIIDRCRR